MIEPTLKDFESPYVLQLIETISSQQDQIEELESGKCRFNCRTAKEAFLAGFDVGAEDAFDGGKIIDDDFYKEVTEEAYAAWREQ